MVDNGALDKEQQDKAIPVLAIRAGIEISYLTSGEQAILLQVIREEGIKPPWIPGWLFTFDPAATALTPGGERIMMMLIERTDIMRKAKKHLCVMLAALIVIAMTGCELTPPRGTDPTENTGGHLQATSGTEATDATEPSGNTDPTEETSPSTEPTDNTEATAATDPTEETAATEATDPTQPEVTEPATQPTQPTKPSEPEVKPTEPKPTEATTPAHKHSYTSKVTKPTCTDKGYTTYTCTCGDSYTGNSVNALGHSYKVSEQKAATCGSAGYTKYQCGNCGHSKSETIAALSHSYSVIGSKAATCTAGGYTEYKCGKCGGSYKEETAALGHSYTAGTPVPPSAANGNGYTPHTCGKCGDTYKDNIVEYIDIAALEAYGEQYAKEKYQFIIDTECYAGYFPGLDFNITTMAEGMENIEAMVDDTYERLKLMIGTDPSGYARINVGVDHLGGDRYLINVYYG